MTVFLLSLAGIPPTAGFIAKVGVFGAAIAAGQLAAGAVGVLASVAAAFSTFGWSCGCTCASPSGEQ